METVMHWMVTLPFLKHVTLHASRKEQLDVAVRVLMMVQPME
jgi:hypothetical protein